MIACDERRPTCEHARMWPGFAIAIAFCLVGPTAWSGDAPRADGADQAATDSVAVEFFEKSVRPILVERCQGCHGQAKQKGGLRLDGRAAILAGGATGPAVVPGNAKESLLIDAINYGETYQMPPKSKLPAAEIATLTDWVNRGAPWGVDNRRDASRTAPDSGKSTLEQLSQSEMQKRAQFWCFRPIRRATPPAPSKTLQNWPRNAIDRFIARALRDQRLTPASEAEKRVLIRRLSFDLIGLPPSPDEIEAFLDDHSPDAYEKLVDRLLSSAQYGERWARHWLDLVRFAESAGHEYDYEIHNAFRYRDYVIRAFNCDIPYDQFVIEHIAGDLLEEPRRNSSSGFNESVIGTAFYFLGDGSHSPVDVREDEMRRIDNQIDVLSKTFLGLTLACARCHDHKFDPISTKDYYALAGFLHSSRYQQAFLDSPDRYGAEVSQLCRLKQDLIAALGDVQAELPEEFQKWFKRRAPRLTSPGASAPQRQQQKSPGQREVFEDFNGDSFRDWFVTGNAFGGRPSQAGDFRLVDEGIHTRLVPVRAGQAHSGLFADRLQGVIRSPSFTINARYIHHRVAGRGARINIVIDNYEKIRDPIYGGLAVRVNHGDSLRWVTQDLGMWLGHRAYIEIADGTTIDFAGTTAQIDDGLGYIAVDEIRMSNQPAPGDASAQLEEELPPPIDLDSVIAALRSKSAVKADALAAIATESRAIASRLPVPMLALAIADGTGQDEHVHIRGSHKNLGEVVPRRFLEVLGGAAPLREGEPSGEASLSTSSSTGPCSGSGRLALAQRMTDTRANPLLARVLVNRLWKHHFGEGIVKSTDDFGAMGQKPSHPELLDWLASELIQSGWSIKAIQRLMVNSSTYRMSSNPTEPGERLDPANVYLHRMNVRRLEAEAIRDAILTVSGRLVNQMYGPAVPLHLTSFMDGRGRPARSGPLDGDGRRSIYLNVRRNFLNPFFLAFDAPVPFSTMGRRNVSNLPAQALALLNDPLVIGQARLWAERELATPGRPPRERIDRLYLTAFGRRASDDEARAALAFVAAQSQTQAHLSGEQSTSKGTRLRGARVDPSGTRGPESRLSLRESRPLNSPSKGIIEHAAFAERKATNSPVHQPSEEIAAWSDLCHVLLNVKSFIFID
jgi:hypothetical protein